MDRPEKTKFKLTRTRGKHRTCDVTLNVVQKGSDVCVYAGRVKSERHFKGRGWRNLFLLSKARCFANAVGSRRRLRRRGKRYLLLRASRTALM
jgi:hypothetical protein